MIVADAGPVIAFARSGRLDILRSVVGEVAVPEAVYQELVTGGQGRPGSVEIEQSPWFRRYGVTEPVIAPDLHEGEREAIALARQLSLPVLMDERRGRRLARRRGVPVVGTLWILATAKRQGTLSEVKPVLEAMLTAGYWISPEIMAAFLKLMGE